MRTSGHHGVCTSSLHSQPYANNASSPGNLLLWSLHSLTAHSEVLKVPWNFSPCTSLNACTFHTFRPVPFATSILAPCYVMDVPGDHGLYIVTVFVSKCLCCACCESCPCVNDKFGSRRPTVATQGGPMPLEISCSALNTVNCGGYVINDRHQESGDIRKGTFSCRTLSLW